ncbi:MAG: excinuclease ABC subunit UvrB [Patescibacteria group bacterium]
MSFHLHSQYQPTGDQPQAIEKLAANVRAGVPYQTLLGVTGSGKTFSVANVIARVQKPTLVISHNKTLAAQLFQEFKGFFPDAAVHYFVSYYDYYQPEAYIPQSDTYIEKDAKINETIDALRHASTASILTRRDVIIVASVSCIYGIGDPIEYQKVALELVVGQRVTQKELIERLIKLQYSRNSIDPRRGNVRVRDNTIEICLPSGEEIIAIELGRGAIAGLSRRTTTDFEGAGDALQTITIFPAKHFVTPQDKLIIAIEAIRQELKDRLARLKTDGKVLEAARLKQRTEYDLAMLSSAGYVNGIENYSRHLSFREPGSPPYTLIDYFRRAYGTDFLTMIDESHATIPQILGMYNGDKSRKQTLIDYGFRLPSALDNRPLTFDEFRRKIPQTIYVSATPGAYEIEKSQEKSLPPSPFQREEPSSPFEKGGLRGISSDNIIQQLIRPTGVLDPEIELRPTSGQIHDVIKEIRTRIERKERALVMALTKRLAEDIAEYLRDKDINAAYLHSEIKTLERPETLAKLRRGEHDVLVGINLLREGLDLPEVSFIAIFDADKEGFLRNETTLLQIIGRAARHPDGKIIMYADTVTGSMRAAIGETNRRRKTQAEYNKTHGITPRAAISEIKASLIAPLADDDGLNGLEGAPKEIAAALEREMKKAAKALDFERAARIRDRLKKLASTKS